ncbi:MAG TPA: TAXI family TRAP transporter solute-binding subunit [Rhodoblastus sp.]|nr:TAXI family TRAP transporter solute-binding subunit [Rhodoblastus sp.]
MSPAPKENTEAGRAAVLAAQNLFGEAARASASNRRQKIVFVALTIVIAALAALLARYFAAPTKLIFATGPEGASSYLFAQKLKTAVLTRPGAAADDLFSASRLRIEVQPHETGAAAVQAFAQRKADLVILRTDVKRPPRTVALAQLEHSVLLVAVPKNARVKTIAAAKGKKIAVIADDARDLALVRQILAYYDLPSTTQIENRKTDEWPSLFEPGGPAAVFFIARKSGLASDRFWLGKDRKVNFELIEPDGVKGLADRIFGVKSETLEAGAILPYPQIPDDDVETLAVDDMLVAHARMSNAVAAQLTQMTLENKDQLALPGRYAAAIEPPDTDKDAEILAHPGAAEYVDDDTKTFLDRYSDLIYIGMSVASVVGSIFLGLYSTVTRAAPVRAGQVGETLLALAKAARAAPDAAALDRVETELDDLVAQLMQRVSDGAVSSEGFETFRLAHDLARAAIARRRDELDVTAATARAMPEPNS